MLRQRLLVAIIGLPLGLAAIILGGYFLFGFALALTLLGLHEYYTLVRPYRPNLLVGYFSGGAVVVFCFVFAKFPSLGFSGQEGILIGLAAMTVMIFFWSLLGKIGAHLVGRIALTSFGVVWVGVGFAYIMLVRFMKYGLSLSILLVVCTVVNDSFAYFVGRAIGRHRLAPRVSPKKTVEGSIGGLVGAMLAALLVSAYADWDMPKGYAVVLGLVVGIVGQWGDLFESAVKRDFQVKDSGKLLPGHGGILDRFDAFLFAGVATYWMSIALFGTGVR
jgi:phosphatidate cytidylyltransferase